MWLCLCILYSWSYCIFYGPHWAYSKPQTHKAPRAAEICDFIVPSLVRFIQEMKGSKQQFFSCIILSITFLAVTEESIHRNGLIVWLILALSQILPPSLTHSQSEHWCVCCSPFLMKLNRPVTEHSLFASSFMDMKPNMTDVKCVAKQNNYFKNVLTPCLLTQLWPRCGSLLYGGKDRLSSKYVAICHYVSNMISQSESHCFHLWAGVGAWFAAKGISRVTDLIRWGCDGWISINLTPITGG